MLAVLQDQKPDGYIDKGAAPPVPKYPKNPTENKAKAIETHYWCHDGEPDVETINTH